MPAPPTRPVTGEPPPTPGAQWAGAATRLGGDPDRGAASGDELDARYDEPHRRYHTGAHVAAVLDDCAWLAEEVQLLERDTLTLAACAHDVVYDARPGEDERASADWAHDSLIHAGVPVPAVDAVVGLVLATTAHEASGADLAAAVLLDADLAILAAHPDTYAAYARAVRAEYAAVSDADWRTGRAAVLRSLLERPELYATAAGRTRWDAAARLNVAAELAALDPS